MNSPASSIKTKPSDESTSSNEMNTFSALTSLTTISSSSPSVNDVNNVAKKVVEGKQILKPYKQMHKTWLYRTQSNKYWHKKNRKDIKNKVLQIVLQRN